MKKIFSLFILGAAIFFNSNCSKNDPLSNEKCSCDSIEVESSSFYTKYFCFFSNKKISVRKSLNGDTIEIKKYYLTDGNIYQKCEYLSLIKGKIDFNKSAFVDIKIDKGYADIELSSNEPLQKINIVLDKYTLSENGNHVKIKLDSLKTLSAIQKHVDKIINSDSIKKITHIFDYYYTYKDIVEERTLMEQYNNLVQCGIIR